MAIKLSSSSNHSGPTTLLSRRYPIIDLSTIAPHDQEWLAQHWVNSNKAWQKNLALGCHTTLNAHTSACMLPGTSLEHVIKSNMHVAVT